MKRLFDYINYDKTNIISLNNFDYDIQEKLKNLDGKKINECCCDAYCTKAKTVADCGCCAANQMIYFYNENEIIEMLNNNVTVQNILNLHQQFGNRFRYNGETPADNSVVLYFEENINCTDNGVLNGLTANRKNAQNDPTVYELIQTLLKKYKLGYPIVLSKLDNTANIYFIRNTGTNGKEGSIKSSLLQMYNILNSLDNEDEINGSQILDVSIDSLDDLYSFVILCSIDLNEIIK